MACRALRIVVLLAVIAAAVPGYSQTDAEVQAYFKDRIGLSQEQITAIRSGTPVVKKMPSRVPAEIFVFGAVYVNAAPESYPAFALNFDRLRKLPGYMGIAEFSHPPQLSDLKGFTFDSEDIKALKECKPGDCDIQMPASSIEEVRREMPWNAPNPADKVNQRLQEAALERLLVYQREGNQVLGVYHDKKNPTVVPEQFRYMLSYVKTLPTYLPDFYRYLLNYPKGKPANAKDTFYWSKVKFGLKPTLRVVQVVTLKGSNATEPAYAIAEKQLYSSHYFQTALDLTFCIRGSQDTKQPGFYLIKVMGSEQHGLTGLKGSIVRKVAVDRSASSLEKALATIRSTLEHRQ
ncbi:MAG: hypothetical protein ACRD2M_03445 [Terriglobales bacterium]